MKSLILILGAVLLFLVAWWAAGPSRCVVEAWGRSRSIDGGLVFNHEWKPDGPGFVRCARCGAKETTQ